MGTETRLWKFLPIVVTLITAFVPIVVMYDLYYRGSIPEKYLELDKRLAVNPLRDLNIKGGNVALNLSVGDKTFNNVVITSFTLRNTGKSPVVPSDYQEPMTVTVKPPWQIIAIENDPTFEDITGITLVWDRVSDQRFEAKPALINPGDYIVETVYLTNTAFKSAQKLAPFPEVDIAIKARITNMQRFTTAPSLFDQLKTPIGFTVYLDGPAVLFTVVVASIFLFWYLILLRKSSLLALVDYKSRLIVVGLAILSISVAEVIAYYIFGGLPRLFKPSVLDWKAQWHNWLVLLLHICISIYLYRRAKLRSLIALSADK